MSHRINHLPAAGTAKRPMTFTKIFRWAPPQPDGGPPATVEVVGSFTEWKPVALRHDRVTNTWQLALHDIPGNCTHRYMLLVNGQPVNDKHCDGLAVPHGDAEKQYQLATMRGPRVFMLFSQTK